MATPAPASSRASSRGPGPRRAGTRRRAPGSTATPAEAAEVYGAIGARPDEAAARIAAARRAAAGGDGAAARQALDAAAAVLAGVRAAGALEEADVVARGLPTPAAAPSPRSAR